MKTKLLWYIVRLLEELVKEKNGGELPATLKDERPPDPPVNG